MIVVISTTVHVPLVLRLHRQIGDVHVIVAGDLKTPAAAEWVSSDDERFIYLPPEKQTKYRCSEIMGWNNVCRRNIALLQAMARPDVGTIISVDDDNWPTRY